MKALIRGAIDNTITSAIIDGVTKTEAVQHFGTQHALAKALGIAQPTISRWGERMPAWRQLQIEALTAGKLKADAGVLPANAKLVVE